MNPSGIDSINAWLKMIGFTTSDEVLYNLNAPELLEYAVKFEEGLFTKSGAFVVNTVPYTGRSPEDKYIVDDGDEEVWLAEGTRYISRDTFNQIKLKLIDYLQKRPMFVRDVFAGAHPSYQVPVRIVTEHAWQNLVACNLFISNSEQQHFQEPGFTLIAASGFEANPEIYGTRSKAFIILDLQQKLVLIGRSKYAGEIKKSIFTLMNYIMPKRDVLSLHCSANLGEKGDVALFFGLSGTGKTTLSSDPTRSLIGDDEHGWSDKGVFNFEGGCYAKTIRLDADLEPLVWNASQRFQTVLENVPLNNQREPDFSDNRYTENTRAAYPLHFIPNYVKSGYGGHPKHIFLLTADAFGVLPPLARLSPDQALYYFLSGYTSKLAGTERGLGQEPEATFSACFGDPFLPLHPSVYANLLGERLEKFGTHVWLLNTGWTGGPYGVGHRIALPVTRSMIKAVLSNSLNDTPTINDEIFNLEIPKEISDISIETLCPEKSWVDKAGYKETARMLANRFKQNFEQYKTHVANEVLSSGPR